MLTVAQSSTFTPHFAYGVLEHQNYLVAHVMDIRQHL
ncbi:MULTISPECIES: DUF1569 domain-containing protein [unclassified Shewanella]